MCCGGAGLYATVQPQLAEKILASKLEHITAANVEQVITANPGCMMQIEQGLHQSGVEGKVLHVVDLLDEAYQLEGE